MKAWKVILAALVIFAAGVVTGGLTVRVKLRELPAPSNSQVAVGPLRPRGELLDRMQRQLYLTPAQKEKIEQILRENHEQMKQLWDSIAPQAQEAHRRVNERIRAELNPQQQTQFEELIKRSPNRTPEDRRRHDNKTSRKSDSSRPGPAAREPAKPEGRPGGTSTN